MPSTPPPAAARTAKILCVAGERSGDLHGAHFAAALQAAGPPCELYGMGMGAMRAAGVRLLEDAAGLDVMGWTAPVLRLPRLARVFRRLRRALERDRPDLFVAIDYPGLNLRLARIARAHGVPTLYYIAPKVWASRPGRMAALRRYVDALAAVFPFEEALFRKADVAARYVGHPLVAQAKAAGACAPRPPGPPAHGGRVLLLPGSRAGELKHILPLVCRAAAEMARRRPGLRFELLHPAGAPVAPLRRALDAQGLDCALRCAEPYAAMRAADVAVAACGSVALQLALCGTPHVVVYRMSAPTYLLARRLARVQLFSPVNLVLNRLATPELIQSDATPDAVADAALALFEDGARRAACDALAEARAALGDSDAAAQTAAMARQLLRAG